MATWTDRQAAAILMGRLIAMIHGSISTHTHRTWWNKKWNTHLHTKSSICKLTNYMTDWHIQHNCPSTHTHRICRNVSFNIIYYPLAQKTDRKLKTYLQPKSMEYQSVIQCDHTAHKTSLAWRHTNRFLAKWDIMNEADTSSVSVWFKPGGFERLERNGRHFYEDGHTKSSITIGSS